MKSHVLHYPVVLIFLVRLKSKFDIDHSWGVKGLKKKCTQLSSP